MGDYVVGVDGCRAGWIACRYSLSREKPRFEVFERFHKLAEEYSGADYIAVDIPIGLRDDGVPRACDLEARRILGRPRGSSVFPAPARCLLQETEYEAASRKSYKLSGKWMTKQQFYIMPKILEVDTFVSPQRQLQVLEVHPEICFWAMADHAMVHRKRSREGYEERRTLLVKHFGVEFPPLDHWISFWGLGGQDVSRDDVLDAAAAAWAAHRTALKGIRKLPRTSEADKRGIRMEMVY